MSVYLSIEYNETDINRAANTSKLNVKLYITSTDGEYNNSNKYGSLQVGDSRYTFSKPFSKNTRTLLRDSTTTITHDTDGTKTVAINGYYKAGVSGAATITEDWTITLTPIERLSYITFDGNKPSTAQGSVTNIPPTQTKTYGTQLYLHFISPTLSNYAFQGWSLTPNGSVDYLPGSLWDRDINTTLYAVWQATSATLNYYTTTLGTSVTSVTLNRSQQHCIISKPTATGYSFINSNWHDNDGNNFNVGAEYKAADSDVNSLGQIVIPDTGYNKLYIQGVPYTYKLIFTVDSSSGERLIGSTYEAVVTFNSRDNNTVNISAQKDYNTFLGWYDQFDRQVYTASGKAVNGNYWSNGRWCYSTLSSGSTITLQAKFTPELNNIKYMQRNNFDADYSTYWTDGVERNTDYTIPKHEAESSIIPSVNPNYCEPFTDSAGHYYWTLNTLLPNIEKYGKIYDQNVLPYNQDISALNPIYSEEDEIANVLVDQNLYVIYRDISPSTINFIASGFQYIDSDTAESGSCLSDYLKFIKQESSSIANHFEASSKYFVCYFKFTNSNPNIDLDTFSVSASWLTSDLFPLTGNYLIAKDSSNIYLLFKNNGAPLPDLGYETETYTFTINSLKDKLGKSIQNFQNGNNNIDIKPPLFILDLNSDGDLLTLFGLADYSIEGVVNKKSLYSANSNLVEAVINSSSIPEASKENILAEGRTLVNIDNLLIYLIT